MQRGEAREDENKKRVNVGQGDMRPEQTMHVLFSHGQSICGRLHVSCTWERALEARQRSERRKKKKKK